MGGSGNPRYVTAKSWTRGDGNARCQSQCAIGWSTLEVRYDGEVLVNGAPIAGGGGDVTKAYVDAADAALQASANDAIEAIEAELGTNPSGASASVKDRLDTLVVGPASASDNALVRFDGTDGKTVQNSGITVDDSGERVVRPDGQQGGSDVPRQRDEW